MSGEVRTDGEVVVRGPGEGRTVLIAGGDYVTYKARGEETGGACFCFESTTLPGFGPPLHSHAFRELFHVLEGEYEFTVERDGGLETFTGAAGTTIAVGPDVPHTFRNAGPEPARMLFVHMPAALEGFFEEQGVPVARAGEAPADAPPPDFPAMAAALERNGVNVMIPRSG